MATQAKVSGERCPVTGNDDVFTDPDGMFVCRSSGIRWAKPKGRDVDADSVKKYHERGTVQSGQSRRSEPTRPQRVGYDAFTVDELHEMAKDRDILHAVTRRDGEDGDPLKSDYVAALEDHDDAGGS